MFEKQRVPPVHIGAGAEKSRVEKPERRIKNIFGKHINVTYFNI